MEQSFSQAQVQLRDATGPSTQTPPWTLAAFLLAAAFGALAIGVDFVQASGAAQAILH